MTQEQFADAIGVSHETGRYQRIALSVAQIKKRSDLMKQAGLPLDELPEDIE